MQFRALPSLLRTGEVVMQEHKFPFRTASDLYRWCLHYGLNHLTTVEPPEVGLFAFAKAEVEDLKDELYMLERVMTVEQLEHAVNLHVKEGSEFYALGMIIRARERAVKIKDKMWRDRVRKEIDKKFKGLLDRREEIARVATERVSMNPLDHEEEEDDDDEQ